MAGTITGAQISQLELNGRDFTTLIKLIRGSAIRPPRTKEPLDRRAVCPMPSMAAALSLTIGKSTVAKFSIVAAMPTSTSIPTSTPSLKFGPHLHVRRAIRPQRIRDDEAVTSPAPISSRRGVRFIRNAAFNAITISTCRIDENLLQQE